MDVTLKNEKVLETSRTSRLDLALRGFTLVLTLIAAVLVGSDKETKIVSLTLSNALPPMNISVTAKWHDMSAFVYLLVTNVIVSLYAAGSLAYYVKIAQTSTPSVTKNKTSVIIIILDLIVTTMTFSAKSASMAIGILGRFGNSHVHWRKVCNVFDAFCGQLSAALVLSMFASFSFLFLVVLSVMKLHKRSMIME